MRAWVAVAIAGFFSAALPGVARACAPEPTVATTLSGDKLFAGSAIGIASCLKREDCLKFRGVVVKEPGGAEIAGVLHVTEAPVLGLYRAYWVPTATLQGTTYSITWADSPGGALGLTSGAFTVAAFGSPTPLTPGDLKIDVGLVTYQTKVGPHCCPANVGSCILDCIYDSAVPEVGLRVALSNAAERATDWAFALRVRQGDKLIPLSPINNYQTSWKPGFLSSYCYRIVATPMTGGDEFEQRSEASLERVLRGVAIVLTSSVIRGVVTAAYWMKPPIHVYEIFATREEGYAWLKPRLP